MTAAESNNAAILVATDDVTDAELVRKHLQEEFKNVFTSTNPELIAQDFERRRPDLLVLAFATLEKSERYYLGLYRLCQTVQQQLHRTIILCNKDQVKQVYELCRKNYFDDYVLFWPMTYDMSRLAMSVHHALRDLAAVRDSGPSATEFAAQARRLNGLEKLFDERFRSSAEAAAPLKQWAAEFKQELAPHLASVRTLNALADSVRPTILVVDDDELQRKLVAKILEAENYRLIFVASGVEALNILRITRPDVVLMDFMMPEMNGIETTKRLKTVPHFAKLPVIMTTGQSEGSVVVDSLKAGASGFLVKPFDRDTLIAKLRLVLNGA